MFGNCIDKQEHMFYTYHYETQEDLSDHTNGAGNTSESDKPSYTYTQIQCHKGWNLKRRMRLKLLYIIFNLFQAFRCVSH